MAARLDIDEYKEKWESMEDGQQIRMDHKNCDAGTDNRQRLYLKKVDGKILGFCHHCSSSAVVSLKGKSSYKSVAALLELEKPTSIHGKLTLPLDAKLVFRPECTNIYSPMVPIGFNWFNPLEMKGRGGLSQAESEDCIKVYLHRCGMLLPSGMALPHLHMANYTQPVPTSYATSCKQATEAVADSGHPAGIFQSESHMMRAFWREIRFSPSQVRLFVPYWNINNMYNSGTWADRGPPPSGYMGRYIMPEEKWVPGTSPPKWLKYPGEEGKGANVYTWNHSRLLDDNSRRLQIYVEDLISQMRIVQALYRSFPGTLSAQSRSTGSKVRSIPPEIQDVGEAQYAILSGLDSIRITCIQGTSMHKDLLDTIIPHNQGPTAPWPGRLRWCIAPWTDLDAAGRKAAASLIQQPAPGGTPISHTVVADEPKNMSDAGIIRILASLTPHQKGWV